MQVTVVGSGYVGLVASACLAELGQQVICVDSDPAKIEALQRGETPIHERFLPELLARHCGTRLTFTSSLADAVQSSAVIFVAVGTPSTESGDCDLSDVEAVARELSRSVNEYKLVVQKSTVPVCTSEWMRRIMLLNGAPENSFEIASNPEFLREGTGGNRFLVPGPHRGRGEQPRVPHLFCGRSTSRSPTAPTRAGRMRFPSLIRRGFLLG